MNPNLTEEETVLLRRVGDRIRSGERKNIPAATGFLSPHEQALVQQAITDVPITIFGGTEDAERAVCCYLPDYLTEDSLRDGELSPIRAVRAEFFAADALNHRDFLGSLMGCGIKRETVGDIFVGEGLCDFLVTREILPYVLGNLESAGRTKLHLRQIPFSEISAKAPEVKVIRATVSSLRLDSVLGSGFNLSRGKASDLVEAAKVSLNDLVCQKSDKAVCEGDKIAVRGLGKMCLTHVGGRTKKDRIAIEIERYI